MTSPKKKRFQPVDVARGVAIVLMVYFHFFFDLAAFNFIDDNFYTDPYWLHLRTIIVSLFLFLVGMSLAIAYHGGLNYRRYFRRLAQLLFFLLCISLVSYLMNSQRVIIIGILHFIFLASILGLLFQRFYYLNLIMGIGIILIGNQFQHPFFNQKFIHWVGLMTHRPQTEDYVPLIPWFGVVLIGVFIGQTIFRNKSLYTIISVKWKNPVANSLEFLGKHSLIIYVIHQPVLYGAIWGLSLALG